MYYEYYNEDSTMNEFIENEMRRTKEFALTKLSSLAHFKTEISRESFIQILVYSWQESLPAAEKLADEVDLCKLDFIALSDDFEEFKKEFLKDMEKAENF